MDKMTKFALGTAVALVIAVPSISFASPAALNVALEEQGRSVKDFTKVSLMGSLDVNVKIGKKISVKIVAPDDLIDKIITNVDGKVLKVHYEKNLEWKRVWNNKEIRVDVTMPDLQAASLFGSGDLSVTGGKGKELGLAIRGSGDAMVAKSNYKKVDISLKGSGDIMIDGKCDHLSVGLMGSGDVSAGGLKCSDAEVHVKGSGDAEVYASSSIAASVNGSGDVSVLGKPKNINKTERGSGDISIRQ